MKVTFGDVSFIPSGDAEFFVEHHIVNTFGRAAVRANVLQAGHHGNDDATSEFWLDNVDPRIGLISNAIVEAALTKEVVLQNFRAADADYFATDRIIPNTPRDADLRDEVAGGADQERERRGEPHRALAHASQRRSPWITSQTISHATLRIDTTTILIRKPTLRVLWRNVRIPNQAPNRPEKNARIRSVDSGMRHRPSRAFHLSRPKTRNVATLRIATARRTIWREGTGLGAEA